MNLFKMASNAFVFAKTETQLRMNNNRDKGISQMVNECRKIYDFTVMFGLFPFNANCG